MPPPRHLLYEFLYKLQRHDERPRLPVLLGLLPETIFFLIFARKTPTGNRIARYARLTARTSPSTGATKIRIDPEALIGPNHWFDITCPICGDGPLLTGALA
jgi:hypothetical protein